MNAANWGIWMGLFVCVVFFCMLTFTAARRNTLSEECFPFSIACEIPFRTVFFAMQCVEAKGARMASDPFANCIVSIAIVHKRRCMPTFWSDDDRFLRLSYILLQDKYLPCVVRHTQTLQLHRFLQVVPVVFCFVLPLSKTPFRRHCALGSNGLGSGKQSALEKGNGFGNKRKTCTPKCMPLGVQKAQTLRAATRARNRRKPIDTRLHSRCVCTARGRWPGTFAYLLSWALEPNFIPQRSAFLTANGYREWTERCFTAI